MQKNPMPAEKPQAPGPFCVRWHNVVMFNPCSGGTEDNWAFGLHEAWYGRPIICFSCES